MRPLSLSDLPPLKLSLPAATRSLRSKIEEAIAAGEIPVARTLTIASLTAGLEFVSQTDWGSILPFWIGLKELGNNRLSVNPIVSPALNIDLALVHPLRQPLTRPAQRFVDHFLEEFRRCEAEWNRLVAPALSLRNR